MHFSSGDVKVCDAVVAMVYRGAWNVSIHNIVDEQKRWLDFEQAFIFTFCG